MSGSQDRTGASGLRGKHFYERHWSTATTSTNTTTTRTTSSTFVTRKSGARKKTSLRHVATSSSNPCPPITHKAPKSPVQTWSSPIITASSQFNSGQESAPSSPMLTGTPVFQSAPSSPMLQSSEWSNPSTTPTSAPITTPGPSQTDGFPFPAGQQTAQETAQDTAAPGSGSQSSTHTSTILIAGSSALGAMLLISALLWALIVRAKRGQRRKHLADVLEKVGTSPSSSCSDAMNRKDSFGNVGLFSPVEWDDLAEKAVGLPSATSDPTLQKDASFCWKYPTLSIPPAAARAMTETHYVKRRSTMPSRPRSDVLARDPPLRDPLAEPTEDTAHRAADEAPVNPYHHPALSSGGDDDDDDGPPAWLIALAGVDSDFGSSRPVAGSVSAPSTSAASDSEARKGWLNFVIPPARRTSTPYNSHVSLAPTARSMGSVYSTPEHPQLPPMVVPSITITVDDGDFGIIDRPLSLIDERGYDSESAEECLDPDEFPTIPRWESQLRRF